MGVFRRHDHRHGHQCGISFATITFLLLTSVSAFSLNATRQFSFGARKMKEEVVERVMIRRRLGGPGSSPPTCRSKCDECSPCKPVHVPIQPGIILPLEYYPEAWRCQCGNKLFMP